MSKDGSFTYDAWILAAFGLILGMVIMITIVFYLKENDVKEMFNFQNQISKDLAQAIYGENSKNLLHVRPIPLRIRTISFASLVCTFLIPWVCIIGTLHVRSSPLSLYGARIAKSGAAVEEKFPWKHPIFWLLTFLDALAVMFAFCQILSIEVLFGECIDQMIVAFRLLRSDYFERGWRWRELHTYVMQLELLNNRMSLVSYHLMPAAVLVATLLGIQAIVGSLRLSQEHIPCVPIGLAYALLGIIALFVVVTGFLWLRLAEILANESESTLTFCRLEHHGSNIQRIKYKRRLFNRKPISMKLAFFMNVEPGMAFGFLQRILDNVLGVITLMDASVHSRLICW